MLNARDYQPSLIWARATDYIQRKNPDREYTGMRDFDLLIYCKSKTGAFCMHSPKLYWTEYPETIDTFQNTDQEDLWFNKDDLAEIVLIDRKWKKSYFLGKNMEQFWVLIDQL